MEDMQTVAAADMDPFQQHSNVSLSEMRMPEGHWLVEARAKLDRRSVLVERVPRGGIELRDTPYDVAFFVEGYLAHRTDVKEQIGISLPEPRWTSFDDRWRLDRRDNHTSSVVQLAVERCTMEKVECYDVDVAGGEADGSQRRMQFCRLSLQRCLADDGAPQQRSLTVDLYVDAVAKDFVVEWSVFKKMRSWSPGERFQMMFKDDEDMEYEEAFAGEVLDARAKMEGEQGHLIPDSPWESVLVKWDLDGTVTRENPWEMMKEGAKPPAVRSRGNNAERQRAEAAQYSRSAFVSLHDDDDRDIAVPLVERYTGEQQEKNGNGDAVEASESEEEMEVEGSGAAADDSYEPNKRKRVAPRQWEEGGSGREGKGGGQKGGGQKGKKGGLQVHGLVGEMSKAPNKGSSKPAKAAKAAKASKGAAKQQAGGAPVKKKKWEETNDGFCAVCHEDNGDVHCKGGCRRSWHTACLPPKQPASSSAADALSPPPPPPSDSEGKSPNGKEKARPGRTRVRAVVQSVAEAEADDGDDGGWKCNQCATKTAECAACGETGARDSEVWKCRMGRCGLFYHADCARRLPLMKWKSDKKASKPVFICSAHFCAGCGMSGDALHMVNCRRCVFSWHTMCVGAHHQLLPPTYRDHVLCGPCRGDAVDKRGKAAQQPPPRGRRVLETYLTTHRPHTAEALLAVAADAMWPKVVTVATGLVTQLRDKPVWFFGPHPKGGGCDWHVAADGVKLVAQLRLQPHVDTGAVVATLRSMHPKLPGCEVTIGGAQLDDKRAEYVLHHDDELSIAGVAFRFDRGAPLPPGDLGPPPRPLQKRAAPAAASAASRGQQRAAPSVTTASRYRGHGNGATAAAAAAGPPTAAEQGFRAAPAPRRPHEAGLLMPMLMPVGALHGMAVTEELEELSSGEEEGDGARSGYSSSSSGLSI